MKMLTGLHDLAELPDEVKEAIEQILGEREAREQLMRMGILESLYRRKGSEVKIIDGASKEDYEDAVNELVAYVRDKFGDSIISIYAVGSYARGDFLPGRSNIDFFIVAKGRTHDVVRTQQQLESYAEQLNEKYLSDVGLALNKGALGLYYTDLMGALEFYIEDAWEYHLLMREAKLLYGEDIRPQISKPDPQKGNQLAQDALKCFYEAMQSKDFVNANSPPLLFALIFKSLALHLSTIGVYVGGKQDVLREFSRLYPDEKEAIASAERAYALWVAWGERDLAEQEISELRGSAIKILETIKGLIKSAN